MFRKTPSFFARKVRGVSLIETLLALSVGGVIVAGSVFGVSEYSNGVKVQSTAVLLKRLGEAAEQYGNLNYATLLANAPQEIDVSVLEPFFGNNIARDAFGSTYRISTRTYDVTVPDRVNGGTKTIPALQMLVLGQMSVNSQLRTDLGLRAEVANTAGATASFISVDEVTCERPDGTARTDGAVCGAFGSYSFRPDRFAASNLPDFAYGNLVTIGDQSVYGDQLYRYDLGDPDLNTMNTDLLMDDHDIVGPRAVTGVNRIDFDGGLQQISTVNGALNVNPAGTLNLAPGNHRTVMGDASGADNLVPTIVGQRARLQLGDRGHEITLGEREVHTHVTDVNIGSADLLARETKSATVSTDEIRSLHAGSSDPLRIQKIANGQAIFGRRVRYEPPSGGTYEIADGNVMTGHLRTRDITCADCGGTLSEVLPKWRHMGTYFVQDNVSRPSGTIIPKPACSANRRDRTNKAAFGDEADYQETANDDRYSPRIVLVPKNIMFNVGASDGQVSATAGTIRFNFFAVDNAPATNWTAYPMVSSNIGTADGGIANALAMTYCVFTGGLPNPNGTGIPGINGADPQGGAWTRLD